MGNIQSQVLERATRAQGATTDEEMRTLRYAVQEELKHLAEDPSKRTLYKLLNTDNRREIIEAGRSGSSSRNQTPVGPEDAARPMSTTSSASGASKPSTGEQSVGDQDDNSLPGSPRLIIDETVDPPLNSGAKGWPSSHSSIRTSRESKGEESGSEKGASISRQPSAEEPPTSRNNSESSDSVSRPRMSSIGQPTGVHKHPKKMFLEAHRSRSNTLASPADVNDARARTSSFSVDHPATSHSSAEEDFRNRTQSVSAMYSLKKRVLAEEKAKKGTVDEHAVKTVSIRRCMNAILESQLVREKLATPPEEFFSTDSNSSTMVGEKTSDSSSVQRGQDMQRQAENRVSSAGRPPQSGSKESEVMADMSGHGPLLMLAAQVDSMRPLPVNKPEQSSSTEPPAASITVHHPPKPHLMPGQELQPSPKMDMEHEQRRSTEAERHHTQRIATIRPIPIPQPPKIPHPVPSAVPLKESMMPSTLPRQPNGKDYSGSDRIIQVRNPFEDSSPIDNVPRPDLKMPGLVPHPQHMQSMCKDDDKSRSAFPKDVLEIEKSYKIMLDRDIQRVYDIERAQHMSQGHSSRSPPEHIERRQLPVSRESGYDDRGKHGPPQWAYHPQTAQEREDILLEARRTLTSQERPRVDIDVDHHGRPYPVDPKGDYNRYPSPHQPERAYHRDRSPVERNRSPLQRESLAYSHHSRPGDSADAPLDLSAKSSSLDDGRARLQIVYNRPEREWKPYAEGQDHQRSHRSPIPHHRQDVDPESISTSEAKLLQTASASYPVRAPPPPVLSTGQRLPGATTMVYPGPSPIHPRHSGPIRPQIRSLIQQQVVDKAQATSALHSPIASAAVMAKPLRAPAPETYTKPPPVEPMVTAAIRPPALGQPPVSSIASRVTVSTLLGEHSSSDILYLRCNLCASTYGNLHSFRKHFSKAHGHDPNAEHITIQTISATKDAIDKVKGADTYQERYQELAAVEKQQALQQLNLLPSNQYYESQLSKYKSRGVSDHLAEGVGFSQYPEGVRSAHSPSMHSPHYDGRRVDPSRRSPAMQASEHSSSSSGSIGEREDQLAPLMSERTSLKCPQCGQEFSTSNWGVFRRHVRAHESSGEGLNKCAVCRETFQDEQQWHAHLLMAHSVKSTAQISCQLCSMSFQHTEALARHYQTAHAESREPEYRCRLCSKSFVHESGLIVHLQEHSKDPPAPLGPPVSHGIIYGHQRDEKDGKHHRPGEYSVAPGVSSGIATMYSRRMSFSEAMQREFKRPASRDSEDPENHMKRPRSGSFPNALDFLERKVEYEHRRLQNQQRERDNTHHMLKVTSPGMPDKHGSFIPPHSEHDQRYALKRSSQDTTDNGLEHKRPRPGSQELIPEGAQARHQSKKHHTTRSLIDEMVETAVNDLASDNQATSGSPKQKILPLLFKGDPYEKVWKQGLQTNVQGKPDVLRLPKDRAPDGGSSSGNPVPTPPPQSTRQQDSSLPSSKQNQDPGASSDIKDNIDQKMSMENLVRQAMITVPFFVTKKPENVREIIESLVTMEISTTDVTGDRLEMQQKIHTAGQRYGIDERVANERLNRYLVASKSGSKPSQGKGETVRETISKAIENHMAQEDQSGSRLRQLMTEAPRFSGDKATLTGTGDQPHRTIVRPQPQVDEAAQRRALKESIEGSGLQSMREICDQIIAKSLSNFEHSSKEHNLFAAWPKGDAQVTSKQLSKDGSKDSGCNYPNDKSDSKDLNTLSVQTCVTTEQSAPRRSSVEIDRPSVSESLSTNRMSPSRAAKERDPRFKVTSQVFSSTTSAEISVSQQTVRKTTSPAALASSYGSDSNKSPGAGCTQVQTETTTAHGSEAVPTPSPSSNKDEKSPAGRVEDNAKCCESEQKSANTDQDGATEEEKQDSDSAGKGSECKAQQQGEKDPEQTADA